MTFVLIVLFISFWLYLIFAGADLGAGILEIFKGSKFKKEQEDLIGKAMGPVWEANHIWLILAIVILFVGFPKIFKEISILLHIPISAVLVGIVLRGSAFTFRHYDAIEDSSQYWYSKVFAWSSLWTTFWIGVIAGSIIEGDFSIEGSDFYTTYISSWFNRFSFLVGFFLCSLLSYITATFMVAEASVIGDQERVYLMHLYKRRSQWAIRIAVFLGVLIFFYGQYYDIYSLKLFFENKYSLICFVTSSLLLVIQLWSIKKEYLHWLKYLGVGQLTLILLGLVFNQFPFLIHNQQAKYFLNFYDSAAPQSTMGQLSLALMIGSIIIFPPYIYMMNIFKKDKI